ncbi:MAG: tRNA pseudouridine(13) synthase TruD [Candidatus Nanoarchaeia archaeon]|nr:tRNA pseudouridine(13) synthase TruD [Candidatus Nanoarchaeia archaeon]
MKIKQIPEDFVVKERIKLKISEGSYSYFKLTKKDWNTLDAVKKIAEKLNKSLKDIGYAGNKDKNAVTEQVISIYQINKEKIENLKIKDISLEFLGNGKDRINLGDLEGNDFIVIVRDLDEKMDIKDIKIKNFFDDQRFGISGNNFMIGKAMVKGDFKKACELLTLEVDGANYVNALRTIERKMLRFYVNAYQSHLFNQALKSLDREKLPVPGFLTKFEDEEVKGVYHEILEKEDIKLKDFIIPSMKEIGSEGTVRACYVHLDNLKTLWQKDELNEGKNKLRLSFSLNKGEYATMVVKTLLTKTL